MRRKMIFHHPGPVIPDGKSGSQVRPWQMLKAFKGLGFQVENISGNGVERFSRIRLLLKKIKQGERYDFVYSESRSIPTLLAETNRLPFFPVFDLFFLSSAHSHGIPVGLFYRDVFWRFPVYQTMLPWYIRLITKQLYHFDWWIYRQCVHHLFLPSSSMAKHLPSACFDGSFSALPPGAMPSTDDMASLRQRSTDNSLRLLYIGGVAPPVYDIRQIFRLARDMDGLSVTICCREQEWVKYKSFYQIDETKNVRIVHKQGKEIADLYLNADLFAILRSHDPYLDFAVPVKLFEALSYHTPVVTFSRTETARTVEREKCGWVIDDEKQLYDLIRSIVENPDALTVVQENVRISARRNTWQERAKQVENQLGRLRSA